MSKRKYKKGKMINSVAEFENSKSRFFIVYFGADHCRTIHYSFLEAWQYHTLKNFIKKGAVYEAESIQGSREMAEGNQ